MKVISLLQPWASLVVMGAKKIETRSWKTSYRGEILIHASKALKPVQRQVCEGSHFKNYIRHISELPFGQIIGAVHIDNTFASVSHDFHIRMHIEDGKPWGRWHEEALEREFAFGDYSLGRYGWELSNPVKFKKGYDCKGALSLWECPGELLEEIICDHPDIFYCE